MLRIKLQSAYYDTPGTAVLRELSFELQQGEMVMLLGTNGCGKSTLLKCLAGLHSQMQGERQLDGRDFEQWSLRERAQRLSYLPQSLSPGFSFRAEEVILLSRYHMAEEQARAGAGGGLTEQARRLAEVAAVMEVGDLLQRHVDELSGGEWQRVALARTLMQDATLLLLDEPTAHLDLTHRLSLFEHCRELARGGKGILCATHDLDAALEYADRIVVLHQGGVVANGKPDDVINDGLIAKVFGAAPVDVLANPLSGRPQLVIRSCLRSQAGDTPDTP